MEGDTCHALCNKILFYFNPLPPHGGRQQILLSVFRQIHFNPLPPHGGRLYFWKYPRQTVHFNPLPPHGGRPTTKFKVDISELFQSTPSAWRETKSICFRGTNSTFQSTPSAWRETCYIFVCHCNFSNFNPLPPHGGRLLLVFLLAGLMRFQSTPSAWRETKTPPFL